MPFIKANNINFYYEQHGQGEDLVLISGLSADHAAWDLQLERLSKQFRVTVFDNRGTGQTDTPPGMYTSELMAEDTVALMNALNIESAHVAGHSMGGQIAQAVGLHYPERIKKLIIVCSTPKSPETANILLSLSLKLAEAGVGEALLIENSMPIIFASKYLEDKNNIPVHVDRVLARECPQTVEGYVSQLNACITHDVIKQLGKITVPTLVIGGEDDILFPIHHSEVMASKIPNALLMRLEDVAHMPNYECPEKYADAILDFCTVDSRASA